MTREEFFKRLAELCESLEDGDNDVNVVDVVVTIYDVGRDINVDPPKYWWNGESFKPFKGARYV